MAERLGAAGFESGQRVRIVGGPGLTPGRAGTVVERDRDDPVRSRYVPVLLDPDPRDPIHGGAVEALFLPEEIEPVG